MKKNRNILRSSTRFITRVGAVLMMIGPMACSEKVMAPIDKTAIDDGKQPIAIVPQDDNETPPNVEKAKAPKLLGIPEKIAILPTTPPIPGKTLLTSRSELPAYKSRKEFETDLAAIAEKKGAQQKSTNFANTGAVLQSDDGASAAPLESTADSNESITNNQESGVEEGGIVQNIGDHLVILRKGQLFAVNVAESGKSELTDSIRLASEDDLNTGVWYDEMLVKGNQIYVIGYRYITKAVDESDNWLSWIHGATEINTFALEEGKLKREETYFFESNDYYSGTNYASRLVNGKLVMYMPYHAFVYDYGNAEEGKDVDTHVHIPRFMKHVGDGNFVAGEPLFSWNSVIKPVGTPSSPSFHTVALCDLPDDGTIDCKSKAVLAEGGRQFYVSKDHIYIWTNSQLYAFYLGTLQAYVHNVQGQPIDQFSFKQVDAESGSAIHVVVQDSIPFDENGDILIPIEYDDLQALEPGAPYCYYGIQESSDGDKDDDNDGDKDDDGDNDVSDPNPASYSCRRPSRHEQRVELLTLPLEDFNNLGDQALNEDTVDLIRKNDDDNLWVSKNRFADNHVLIALSGYDRENWKPLTEIAAHKIGGNTKMLDISGRISRIDLMGSNAALVVSQDYENSSLHMNPVLLGDTISLGDEIVLDSALEGETRSHGYFYKPLESGGIFGLPVLSQNQDNNASYWWWGGGASNIAFFNVDAEGAIEHAGNVATSDAAEGQCQTSCVDWYGNTRPIFLKDRIFALMGSEIAEARLEDGSIIETDENGDAFPRVLLTFTQDDNRKK